MSKNAQNVSQGQKMIKIYCDIYDMHHHFMHLWLIWRENSKSTLTEFRHENSNSIEITIKICFFL